MHSTATGNQKIVIGLGIGAGLVLAVYILTASPAIGWVDSGVIAAAAKTLGIPNPPGFPAYLLVAHLFTLIPWGGVVFNLKLLSQLSAIGISGGVFWLVWHLSPRNRKVFSAIIAALAVAFSYNLWSQANNIETYTFTNLILLGFFIWLVWSREKFKPWLLPLLGLAGGLSLGLNPMIVSIIPAALWWAVSQRKFLLKNPVPLILILAAGIAGAIAIYSYLPLRAATHPFVNWGDPQNFDNLRKHLVGAGLNIYEPETNSINGFTGQPKVWWESFLHFWHLAFLQFTPLLFPLVFWGAWQLWLKNRTVFWLAAAVILSNLAFVVLYYGGNQESWMITSWMIMAVFLGCGVAHLPERFYKPWILILAIVPLVFWFPLLNRSGDRFAFDYARVMYKEVPPNSVIVGGGDFFNSLTAFTHEVTGERKDVVPVTGNMFYIFPWYRENLRRNTNLIISQKVEEIIKFKSVDEFTQAVDQLIEDNPGRTFFVTPLLLRDSVVAGTNQGNYRTLKYLLIPHGLLLQVTAKDSSIRPDEKLADFPVFDKEPFYLERNYKNAHRLLRNDYAVGLAQFGDYFLAQNDTQKALDYFQKAIVQATPDTPEFVHRLAIFYAQTGQNDLANRYFQTALSRDPDNAAIRQNLQTFMEQTASSSAQLSAGDAAGFKAKSGLKFDYPKDWSVREENGEIIINAPGEDFRIQITKNTRQAEVTIEEYLAKQKAPGQILDQGLAKIPNTDLTYVRVISSGGKSQLEFFLFKADVVLRVLVGPADSPQMKVFDAIVTSLKL